MSGIEKMPLYFTLCREILTHPCGTVFPADRFSRKPENDTRAVEGSRF